MRAISDAAAARGLHFQLGLWTHAYEWIKSPDANHRIEGLTPATHGAYCRDALTQLLKACPNISGVTFRVHGESGVAEGSYEFWKTVFDGVRRADRRIEIDMHAKGMDSRMIETAVASGMPIVISPKFWAEHMGLPYNQAWIRPTELPKRERGEGPFANSSGSRSFLRYGYGDLLTEDRPYRILHRIWPGTQRLLQWGDPATAAAYGRASSFCGSAGCEPMEPLSFKGRKGSGSKGPRTARVEARSERESPSESPWASASRYDFETYLYTYRLWGRLLYNPDTPPDAWQRLLRTQHGGAAASVEAALAAASRVLPLVTTAHLPSAANNNYWPEMYTNMSISDASHPEPYTDTPSPKRFGAVSPLDPQLFSSVDACVDEWLQGHPSGRYTPIDVATRLEDLAGAASRQLTEASSKAGAQPDAAFQRVALDIAVQADLARFFALKLRAAVLYALFERTGEPRARARAVDLYRSARDAWARIAEQTNHRFVDDVTFGPASYQRGHWRDRLAAIDKDIAAMMADLSRPPRATTRDAERFDLIDAAVDRAATRPSLLVRQGPPSGFRRGQSVAIDVADKILAENVEKPASGLRLRYRRTNQAEPWQSEPMTPHGSGHRATVPPEYADSPFALQYYFDLLDDVPTVVLALYPGFDQTWCNQPYFVVRQAASTPPPRSAGYIRNTPNFEDGIGAL